MKRWTSAVLLAVLVAANGWLAFAPERATSQETYHKVCGCVYGGGPGGPSGPGTPTCFDLQPENCNNHSDCEQYHPCAQM
jgi:hypothetical protein